MDEMYFGVHDQLLYARKTEPIQGTILTYAPLVDSSPPPLPLPSITCPQPAPLQGRGKKRNIYSVPHGHLKKPKLHAPASHVIYICALHAGAQWTGIVTTIAVEMLKANMVDAVVCVQRQPNKNQMPHPSFSLQCTSITTWV